MWAQLRTTVKNNNNFQNNNNNIDVFPLYVYITALMK